MSIRASKWAWMQPVSGTCKLVLLVLADCHNQKTGQCNPSVSTIARMVGKTETPVKQALRQLFKDGYFLKSKRTFNGRQSSNQYELQFDFCVVDPADTSPPKKTHFSPPKVSKSAPPNKNRNIEPETSPHFAENEECEVIELPIRTAAS